MSDDKRWMVANPLHLLMDHGDYETLIKYPDDSEDDPDADQPTEWEIFRKGPCDIMVATGWGRTPKDAEAQVDAKLAQLRSTDLQKSSSV